MLIQNQANAIRCSHIHSPHTLYPKECVRDNDSMGFYGVRSTYYRIMIFMQPLPHFRPPSFWGFAGAGGPVKLSLIISSCTEYTSWWLSLGTLFSRLNRLITRVDRQLRGKAGDLVIVRHGHLPLLGQQLEPVVGSLYGVLHTYCFVPSTRRGCEADRIGPTRVV